MRETHTHAQLYPEGSLVPKVLRFAVNARTPYSVYSARPTTDILSTSLGCGLDIAVERFDFVDDLNGGNPVYMDTNIYKLLPYDSSTSSFARMTPFTRPENRTSGYAR